MSTIHGRKGLISLPSFTGGTIMNVQSFTLDDKVEAVEDTALQATTPLDFKTFNFGGLREIDITIEAIGESGEIPPDSGTTGSATLSVDTDTNWVGTIGIVTASYKVDRADLQRLTLTCKGSGIFTKSG